MSTNIAVRAGRTAAGLGIMAILGLGNLIGAQNIIENPAKPKAVNAGRVVAPAEAISPGPWPFLKRLRW